MDATTVREPSAALLHMCTIDEWQSAHTAGEFRPESLVSGGFVHLSTGAQVHLPANRLFGGRVDVVLLVLNVDKLDAPIRWEPGVPTDPESMLFPHLYGPIPLSAVTAVVEYLPDSTGKFLPPSL